eukprot:s497_g13.t1
MCTQVWGLYRPLLGLDRDADQHVDAYTCLALLDLPSPAVWLRFHRLLYLGQLVTSGPPALWAVLRADRAHLSLLLADLLWLHAWTWSTVDLPNPAHDWPAWLAFIQAYPRRYKGLVKRARALEGRRNVVVAAFNCLHRSLLVVGGRPPAADTDSSLWPEVCMPCRRAFPTRRSWAGHCARKHGYRCHAFLCAEDTTCRSCGKRFASVGRLRRHLVAQIGCVETWGSFVPARSAPTQMHPQALRATVEEWKASNPSCATTADTADNVLLLLDVDLLADSQQPLPADRAPFSEEAPAWPVPGGVPLACGLPRRTLSLAAPPAGVLSPWIPTSMRLRDAEPDISGSTALMVAARNRKVRIVKAIINWTVTPEREEMLEEAEKADAKFNILKNLELLRVVGANDRMSVIQLVQVGDGMGTGLANIQFRDAQGRQCAHVAIMCIGEEEEACAMLRLIASLKGEVNGQDFSGLTPLHLAARLGRHEAAKALLALKAHPGLIDKQGRTPLMVAASAGLFVEALAAFRGLDPPAISTPELLEAIAQCELMLDTASSAHRAVEAARNAVALAPGATLTLPEAKQTLARALMSAFRVPEAIEMYQQVLTLCPGDPEASAELSEASAALKAHERRLATLPGTEDGSRIRIRPGPKEAWAARRRRLFERLRAERRPNWKEADWKVHAFARLDLGAIYGRCMNNIARVDVQDEKYKNFGQEYQSRSLPALINGAMHRWPAMGRWSLENFAADFGHQKIICDHRFGIRMRFNDFRDYMAEQEDDTPLYLFDHAFGEYPATKTLLCDYEAARRSRVCRSLDQGRLRPPFRWLLLGPRRSGSTLHKDPLGTSAWNALVFGKKLWVLFPPSTPPELLRPEASRYGLQRGVRLMLATTAAVGGMSARARAWPEQFRPIEFLQQPGEVVFVPARWWHAVLNLEDSLAVTQNFCNEWNVGNVWRCTSATHPVLARHLRQSLKCQRPESRHTGRLVNEGFAWSVANVVLNWDGRGAPPAELPLRPPGPPEPIPEDPKRPKKSHAEQAAEEEAARNELPFGSSELEKVKARADVLCSLGFDDQYIYSVDGKALRIGAASCSPVVGAGTYKFGKHIDNLNMLNMIEARLSVVHIWHCCVFMAEKPAVGFVPC